MGFQFVFHFTYSPVSKHVTVKLLGIVNKTVFTFTNIRCNKQLLRIFKHLPKVSAKKLQKKILHWESGPSLIEP